MRKFLKSHFYYKAFKEDCRKLGVGLSTAASVGGLISHITDAHPIALIMSGWVLLAGVLFWIFGLHKGVEKHV